MPQNRPWVISHSLSVEKIVLWDGFGGFEVLSVAATGHEVLEDPCLVSTGELSLISENPWNPQSLFLHGTFWSGPAGKWGGGKRLKGQEVASVTSLHFLQVVGLGKVWIIP